MVLYCLHVHIISKNKGADQLRGNTAQLLCAFVFAYAKGRFLLSPLIYKQDIVSSPDLKVHRTHGPASVVVHNAQTSSPKPLGRSKPNFMWSLLG